MSAIATLSGATFDYAAPRPEQIHTDDIAVALSRHPRYCGQTTRRYTVAMHSVLVADLVEPEHRLHALLHDATEAYVCDLPSPAKKQMRDEAGGESDYDRLEARVWAAIARRYDIPHAMPAAVVAADRLAMCVEAPVLQPRGWRTALWDFARADELRVSGVHRERLLQLCAQPDGGYGAWVMALADELTRRTERA